MFMLRPKKVLWKNLAKKVAVVSKAKGAVRCGGLPCVLQRGPTSPLIPLTISGHFTHTTISHSPTHPTIPWWWPGLPPVPQGGSTTSPGSPSCQTSTTTATSPCWSWSWESRPYHAGDFGRLFPLKWNIGTGASTDGWADCSIASRAAAEHHGSQRTDQSESCQMSQRSRTCGTKMQLYLVRQCLTNSLGNETFSHVTFDVIYFRVMANIKPQSSLTQQQGMQVYFL